MLETFRVIWRETTRGNGEKSRFHPFNWSMFFLFFASVIVIGVCELNGGRYYDPYRGWYYMAPGFFLLLTFLGPVMRVAKEESTGRYVLCFSGASLDSWYSLLR